MANYSFTGTTKIITPADPPVGGVINIDVQDLYSRWVDWLLTSDNSKYLVAMRVVGGDPLPGSKQLGLTYFLTNGWRIRPYEASHTMNIDGNLYTEEGVSPFIPTVGTYNVTIINSVSNLVDSTVQQLPEIEYASFEGGVTIDVVNGSSGTAYPRGTRQSPVNNLQDAKTIAQTRGFYKLFIKGNITIGASDVISGYTLTGEGAGTFNISKTTITLADGCTTSTTVFEHAKVQGKQNGECIFFDCVIGVLTNTHCRFKDCAMIGQVQMNNSEWTQNHTTDLINCHSSYEWYVVDYNNSPINQVYSNYSGKIKIMNCTDARADIMIRLDAGMIWIDASCTAGSISVRGMGTLQNDSNVVVDTTGFLEGTKLADIHDEAFGKWVLNPIAKTMTLYKADGITILKQFNLTDTQNNVPIFIERIPV